MAGMSPHDADAPASLTPVSGPPRAVEQLLRTWAPDDGPLVIRTSGSTGTPKDVLLSHAAMTASATATHERLGGPGQWLLALPSTGVAGLQVLFRSRLAGTSAVVADEHLSLTDAIAAMDGERRYASLVPTQLYRLVEAGDVGVLARLDAVLVGGASVSPRLVDHVRDAGVNVVRTYGMSETCGGCVYDGVPLDGVRLDVAEDGRIRIAGDVLMDGYADPEATAEVLRDGWFDTRDLGEIRPDGRLRVLGRADDVVVSGGVNVATSAVTGVLRDLDGVDDVLVVGVPDAEWGERVVACLVGDATLTELRDTVEAAGLPRTWAPRDVVRVEALPHLPGGKVDRVAVRELAARELASGADGS